MFLCVRTFISKLTFTIYFARGMKGLPLSTSKLDEKRVKGSFSTYKLIIYSLKTKVLGFAFFC